MFDIFQNLLKKKDVQIKKNEWSEFEW